jgi:Na+-translocating ferredoxin:NAD+ oxidoreductase RnfG subunit
MKKPMGWSVLALASLPVPLVAYSQVYLTEDQALGAVFPGVKMSPLKVTLTDAEAEKIEKDSGEKVRARELKIYRGIKGEILYIDQVLGKHEFITFAVGIGVDHKVHQIEIMEYRETYGDKVRLPEWRAQFVGKDKDSALKLGQDIRNISGATLSSAHLTAGVRRILKTHETIQSRL